MLYFVFFFVFKVLIFFVFKNYFIYLRKNASLNFIYDYILLSCGPLKNQILLEHLKS